MKFKESKLAHKHLDGKWGIEVGQSAHNPFGLAHCLNIDNDDNPETEFKQSQMKLCGEISKVDIKCEGDDLPFKDNTLDFVLSSHVLEHFFDPIKTINEWLRVVKKKGLVFMIIPHAFRTFDKGRPLTSVKELMDRHSGKIKPADSDNKGQHWSVWVTETFMELCDALGYKIRHWEDVDDKVSNGFLFILEK